MLEKTYKIALMGAGRIGQVHAENISSNPRSELVAVVDPFGDSAEKIAYKHQVSVKTESEVLADPEIDAIVVCSSTDTHAGLIEAGMTAGKDVFCEKPVDLSIDRVNACLDAVKDRSEILFLGFNRRFDPAIRELKQRLVDGVVGEIEMLTVISKDPGALPIEYLKASGGMFRDMTIHDFDMVRYILGEEIVSVHATASTLTDPAIAAEGDIDTACVTMKTATDKIAIITNSRRACFGYDQRVEVHASEGTLRTENVAIHNLVQESESGVLLKKPQFFFLERYAESYRTEWAEFIRALDGKNMSYPSGEDGRKALLLAEAAYKSLETCRTVNL